MSFVKRAVSTCIAAALCSTAWVAHAADHEVATSQVDTEVKFLTDQRTRGVSDSMMQPAIKFTTSYAHESGFVAVADLVTVSKQEFPKGAGFDLTLGAGYRFGDPDAWHFGVGMAAEIFPGARFPGFAHQLDPNTGTFSDFRDTSIDSEFALLEFGYGALEGRALSVISKNYRGTDTGSVCYGGYANIAGVTGRADLMQKTADCFARGDHNSRGSLLLDLNYKIDLTPTTKLNLHVGQQSVANFHEGDTVDYGIGVTHKHWGFDWSADWVYADVKTKELFWVVDGPNIRQTQQSTVVFSVAKKL